VIKILIEISYVLLVIFPSGKAVIRRATTRLRGQANSAHTN